MSSMHYLEITPHVGDSDVLVEMCNEILTGLDMLCVVLKENVIDEFKEFIRENNKNSDFLIEMLEDNPEDLFKFIKGKDGFSSYTEAFLDKSGLSQDEFYAKYMGDLLEVGQEDSNEESIEEEVEEIEEPTEEEVEQEEEPVEEVEEPAEEVTEVEERISEIEEESVSEIEEESVVTEIENEVQEESAEENEEVEQVEEMREEDLTVVSKEEDQYERVITPTHTVVRERPVFAEEIVTPTHSIVKERPIFSEDAIVGDISNVMREIQIDKDKDHVVYDVKKMQNNGMRSSHIGDGFTGIKNLQDAKKAFLIVEMGTHEGMPNAVITKEELDKSLDLIDEYSPSLIKEAIQDLVRNASTEKERQGCEILLDCLFAKLNDRLEERGIRVC